MNYYGELENILRQHQHGLHQQMKCLSQSKDYAEAIFWQDNVIRRIELLGKKYSNVAPVYQEMYADLMAYKTLEWAGNEKALLDRKDCLHDVLLWLGEQPRGLKNVEDYVLANCNCCHTTRVVTPDYYIVNNMWDGGGHKLFRRKVDKRVMGR